MEKHVDILIMGAGISGIGVAVHLLKNCPQRQFEIIERRASFGGTWDLFKYPGIRSDSDMSTFGFKFKPWQKNKVLADAGSIKRYLSEVISDYNLQQKIHFQHHILSANYDSQLKKWSVNIQDSEQQQQVWVANFIFGCTGYYNYDQGYQPTFPNQQAFKGQWIHPQHWPENFNYKNKKVVIIGSGATAISLVPAMVKAGAAHVTMLQRSPTYIVSIASVDHFYRKMRQFLPEKLAYRLTRGRNIALQRSLYLFAQKQPKVLRKFLLKAVEKQLQGTVDMKHFTPAYQPWDQRLCVVPDGDLFKLLSKGQASVETDQIEQFTEQGIVLKSGQQLDADIIVTATGLQIQILGGIQISIDHQPIDPSKHMLYQGTMLSDIPNMAILMGYINASWTLKVDITAEYLCRLINYMDKNAYTEVMAQADPNAFMAETVMGSLSSSYIARAIDVIPKQGKHAPWQVSNNYLADRKQLRKAKFKDAILKFS